MGRDAAPHEPSTKPLERGEDGVERIQGVGPGGDD
jgi:hypothetical protein